MSKVKSSLKSEQEADLIKNPIKHQMWHHSFDPHSQVPKIELASLNPPPSSVRSSTLNNFLTKSSMPALV